MVRVSRWIVVLSLLVFVGCPWSQPDPDPQEMEFVSADIDGGGGDGQFESFDDVAEGAPTADDAEGDGDAPARDVVEPDVIRVVGNLLYVLNQFRGLTIVDLESETILSQLPTVGFPRDMFIENGQAFVLVGAAQDVSVAAKTIDVKRTDTRLYVVDVSSPNSPEIQSTFDLRGDYVDSRLVGDVVYAVTADYGFIGVPIPVDGEPVFEGDVKGDFVEETAPVTRVTSIDASDVDNVSVADTMEFSGFGHVIQVTPDAVFVASNDGFRADTVITSVDISDPSGALNLAGMVDVRGHVADKFKMDAHNGVLRVVSIDRDLDAQTFVTTIDLGTLGVLAEKEIEGARGETLFATRFDGDKAYIVTFFVIDPLFVVDLSDPENPTLAGELEVPGYSTYIEPRGDRLIGVGVDDSNGFNQVSVSIYDVSGAPRLVDRVNFGEGWSWSNAFSDVKALTILDDTIIVPFSGWSDDFGGFERLQFISYTLDDLELRGFADLDGTVLRSFKYNENYYGVTTEQLAFIDGSNLDDPEARTVVTLAEHVADTAELSSDVRIDAITRFDDGVTILRTVAPSGQTLDEVRVEIGVFHAMEIGGNTIALVGVAWDDRPRYQVAVIDASDPAALAVNGAVDVNVQPFFGYYGPIGIEPFVDVGFAEDSLIAPDIIGIGGDSTFLAGRRLVLRCFADDFDWVVGDAPPSQGLAVVNVDTVKWESTAGLGFERINSVDESGGLIYAGSKVELSSDLNRPLCAFNLTEIDVANRTAGPATNVPGAFVEYDGANDVLTLRDFAWRDAIASSFEQSLRTVEWDGAGTVRPLDEVKLPDDVYIIHGAGDRAYVESYFPGFGLYPIAIASNGDLRLGERFLITNNWGAFLGARSTDVVVSVSGTVIAHYDFSGAGALVSYVQTSGGAYSASFGGETVYVPLGYWGVVTLPLLPTK